MELLRGMRLHPLDRGVHKITPGFAQRNEGHFHLSSKETTTYKELWLAVEIPRALQLGCITFFAVFQRVEGEKTSRRARFTFSRHYDNAALQILESNGVIMVELRINSGQRSIE